MDKAILVVDKLRNDVFAAFKDLKIPGILHYSPFLCVTHAGCSNQARRKFNMLIENTYNEHG